MSNFNYNKGNKSYCTSRGNRRPNRGRFSYGRNSRGRYNTNSRTNGQVAENFVNPCRCEDDDNSQENLQHLYKCNAKVIEACVKSGPYFGWKMYITNDEYNDSLPALVKLKAVQQFYRRNDLISNSDDIEDKRSFVVSYKDITTDEEILKIWPEVAKDIQDTPDKCINYFGLAMHQILSTIACEEIQNKHPGEECTVGNLPKINARIIGFEPHLHLKNLKSNCYSKFVSVKGTVIRVSNVKPLCTKLAFGCGRCGKVFVYSQPYGNFTSPAKCVNSGCSSQIFHPLRNSSQTETVDWQSIKLQEITDEQKEVGRMPRSVECELMYDLVDTCVPGDVVTVTGIVNVTSGHEGRSKFSKDKCTFLLYILVNSLSNCQSSDSTNTSKVSMPIGLELSVRDLYAVQAIQAEDNLFKLLCTSLCPSIYGHEMVKAGLLLGLLGGTRKFISGKNRIPVRGDPHILIVGDPGLGKSQMLQACANIAPRGVYVCGNTTTTSGLTVTLTRGGGGSGDYALEAGALVLGDQGCCCIDEFDKMTNQHHALLEAMEQQTISLAKAGIVCSLPARTSILAAANPIGGHYNKAKTVAENLKMGSALLSRFDLVFILLDKPNKELDSKLSEHVMALHSGKIKNTKITANQLSILQTQTTIKTPSQLEKDQPLTERLKYIQNEECEPIPHQLLRKYIAYARKYVHPKITQPAAEVLQKFYIKLRQQLQTSDSTPVTTRQLESLIRLTEARARLELREECTKEDALDVVDIMKHSMVDVWSDCSGILDMTRSQHGSGMSARSQAKKFIAILTHISERTNNSLFSVQQLKQIAKDENIKIVDFENFLLSLNTQGYFIKKGRGIYKLLSVDY